MTDSKVTPVPLPGFPKEVAKAKATPTEVLAAAPSVTEVLARPMVYEAWLKKAQEALNG